MTGLLTLGVVVAGVTTANANTAGSCTASSTATVKASCAINNHTISDPATIYVDVAVTKGANQIVNVTWRAQCTLSGDTETNFGGAAGTTPSRTFLVIPFPTPPDSCDVNVSATLGTNSGTMQVTLTYAPNPNATPPAPAPPPATGPVHLYRGLGGKCVDDSGNRSANRAKVVIWTCNSNDKAQAWTYTNGQLKHNGLCLNDQRSGGNGSKVILYSCNGGANEKWTHQTNGEFVLKANGGKYCLDDPASSKKNGTQLIVWKCNNRTNQHWFQSTVG